MCSFCYIPRNQFCFLLFGHRVFNAIFSNLFRSFSLDRKFHTVSYSIFAYSFDTCIISFGDDGRVDVMSHTSNIQQHFFSLLTNKPEPRSHLRVNKIIVIINKTTTFQPTTRTNWCESKKKHWTKTVCVITVQ